MTSTGELHWENIYTTKLSDQVSWYQSNPSMSLRLIQSVATLDDAIVDVGAGASLLVDGLLDRRFKDLTVVDISEHALDLVRDRLGDRVNMVQLIHSDVLIWRPDRTFKIWHDRAVFHFLTDSEDRDRHVSLAEKCIAKGGYLILATFALDGPIQCSGLDICQYDGAASQTSLHAASSLRILKPKNTPLPRAKRNLSRGQSCKESVSNITYQPVKER